MPEPPSESRWVPTEAAVNTFLIKAPNGTQAAQVISM